MLALAVACQVMYDFIAPTNPELVAEAPVIVVARAETEHDSTIDFAVTKVIKGSGVKVGEHVAVYGLQLTYDGPSPVNDFSEARPGSRRGGCLASDFALEKTFLLMLRHDEQWWFLDGPAYTRVSEEVDPAGDAWTTAVTEYARIFALPAAARRKELDALVAKGAAPKATAADQAIAADVASHLATPTLAKSFTDLRAMYDAGGDTERIMLAIGRGGDPAAKAFMGQFVKDQFAREVKPIGPPLAFLAIAAYYARVPDPAAMADVAALQVRLGAKAQVERWPLTELLIEHADVSLQPQMETVIEKATNWEAAQLGAWFARARSPRAIANLQKRLRGRYYSQEELTLAAAAAGDPRVIAWAKKVLAGGASDYRERALYAIARSPLPSADALAAAVIERGGSDLSHLIEGYEDARHPLADQRLKQIAATYPTGETKEWADRMISARAARFDPSR